MKRRNFLKLVAGSSMLLPCLSIAGVTKKDTPKDHIAFSTLREDEIKFITRALSRTYRNARVIYGGDKNSMTRAVTLKSPNYPNRLWILRIDGSVNDVIHVRDIIAVHNL